MILPFSQFFDKEKQKPTFFMEKIYRLMLWNSDEIKSFANVIKSDISRTVFFDKEISFNSQPKIHTISADFKNRWQVGRKIHAVYNNRQKNQFQFAPTFTVKGIQTIEIKWIMPPCQITVKIDNKLLSLKDIQRLAINDGFENLGEFTSWFNTDFKGKIIHFTDFIY